MQMSSLFERLDGVAQSARSLPHWGGYLNRTRIALQKFLVLLLVVPAVSCHGGGHGGRRQQDHYHWQLSVVTGYLFVQTHEPW